MACVAQAQAQDRIHRLGQFRPITVVRFFIAGTVEERILKLQVGASIPCVLSTRWMGAAAATRTCLPPASTGTVPTPAVSVRQGGESPAPCLLTLLWRVHACARAGEEAAGV